MDNNFKSLPSGRPEKAFYEAYDAYKYLKDTSDILSDFFIEDKELIDDRIKKEDI